MSFFSKKKYILNKMSTFAMFQVYQDHIKKRNVRCPEDMKWLKQYLEKNI